MRSLREDLIRVTFIRTRTDPVTDGSCNEMMRLNASTTVLDRTNGTQHDQESRELRPRAGGRVLATVVAKPVPKHGLQSSSSVWISSL